MRLLASKRGVSPVISTVILVAVAITVAVAVAYWMGGIAGQYTRFEKLEVVSAYAVKDDSPAQWNVTMKVKNTGSTDATFEGIYINGKPLTDFSPIILTDAVEDGISTGNPASDVSINSGAETTIHVYIDLTLFEAGTTIELKLHTATGLDYPQMITLP
jgi:flagellin-like protein